MGIYPDTIGTRRSKFMLNRFYLLLAGGMLTMSERDLTVDATNDDDNRPRVFLLWQGKLDAQVVGVACHLRVRRVKSI